MQRNQPGKKALLIASETKALADDILISGINSFIFSYLFALIWRTLGLVQLRMFRIIYNIQAFLKSTYS